MSQSRWTESLIATLRDNPQDAEIPSHQLMLRAGLIRKLSGGLYTFMPLGCKALRRVETVVRQEMDRAGALEILMPALQPREIWEQSGRYGIMGEVMFKLHDRQKRELVLGPTHEEVVTLLAAGDLKSYRQLPRTLYQIQTKFRDEIRPRFGLMRAKEFIMKDAYSFDRDWDAADASYRKMYEAYLQIFARCGLRVKVVEADTGAMGGQWSHEFMVLADSGEDGLVECDACAYAANLERAERAQPIGPAEVATEAQPLKAVATPGMRTIEQVASFLKCEPSQIIKTLIYIADGKTIAVLAPGDRELNEHKLAHVLEARALALADDAIIVAATSGPVGYSGPVGLNIPVYADSSLKTWRQAVTGANKADTHWLNVALDRDASITAWHDLCTVKNGDRCPRCAAGMLREKRGIEVGHVFKLGSKYTEAFSACYLDESGEASPMVMGCYGIGVTRTLQSVIEQSHDDKGIIWPMSIAPYPVVILNLSPANPDCTIAAQALADTLDSAGLDVLIDDRDDRPGVKFADADLLGFPIRAVVSERSLAGGHIELKLRTETKPTLLAQHEASTKIIQIFQDTIKALIPPSQ